MYQYKNAVQQIDDRVFEGSDIKEVVQHMFFYAKTQVENPGMPESGFTLDQTVQSPINFYKLALMRGSSYSELPLNG